MSWIDKLERRFGKYAIKGLMKYIIGITAFVFLLNMIDPTKVLIYKIALIPEEVMKGEVWRLITYIFIPPTTDIIWILFILYFYYMIGISLENEWGSFRFNLYYIIGMIGTTISVLITGGIGTSVYLNLSMFLAFAYIYPNYEILLFFILPIKVKYLGYLNWAFIIVSIIAGSIPSKVAAIASVINFFVFFGGDIVRNLKSGKRAYYNKKKFQDSMPKQTLKHKCRVCGITLEDDPNMDFRYCPECDGLKCYCSEHIRNHEHIKDEKGKVIDFSNKK